MDDSIIDNTHVRNRIRISNSKKSIQPKLIFQENAEEIKQNIQDMGKMDDQENQKNEIIELYSEKSLII